MASINFERQTLGVVARSALVVGPSNALHPVVAVVQS
jgi:hypothetical protein